MWEDVRCIILSEYDYKCLLIYRQSKHINLEDLKTTHKSSVLSDFCNHHVKFGVLFPSKIHKRQFFPQKTFKITDMLF